MNTNGRYVFDCTECGHQMEVSKNGKPGAKNSSARKITECELCGAKHNGVASGFYHKWPGDSIF